MPVLLNLSNDADYKVMWRRENRNWIGRQPGRAKTAKFGKATLLPPAKPVTVPTGDGKNFPFKGLRSVARLFGSDLEF